METDDNQSAERSMRRGKLKQYYLPTPEYEIESFDPFNINGPDFNPELFINKLLKEYSLAELMEKESEIYRQIQLLDSEMQTLVYENYNKFISATDTIRKMKQDFKKMEEEMDLLASNMSSITEFSENISSTLQGKRDRISQLSGTHSLLRKLQFLFELPPQLKKFIEKGSYGQAVRSYLKAEAVLRQYQHMASFQGIQEDCDTIVQELKGNLRSHFQAQEASPKQLAECVDMLLQLKEPPEQLCQDFLSHARVKLDSDLKELERQSQLLISKEMVSPCSTPIPAAVVAAAPCTNPSLSPAENMLHQAPMDVLEFVDWSCNHFLSNLCLVIASFRDMFVQRIPNQQLGKTESLMAMANQKLISFSTELMQRYFEVVESRFLLEREIGDTSILVRALDRFHRRLQAINKLLPEVDFTKRGLSIVSQSGKARCKQCLEQLCQHFGERLTYIRQALLTPPRPSGSSTTPEASWLAELLNSTEMNLCEKLRAILQNLKAFIEPEVMFASQPTFRDGFCVQDVREGVVVQFLRFIIQTVKAFCQGGKEKGSPAPPAGLILLLSRFCLDLENSTVSYLLSIVDDQFGIEDWTGSSALTSGAILCQEMRDSAQALLDCYVRIQGLAISQMLRKSVETRDWMSTIEPRNVRAVMKRVVEDLTSLETLVGQLYEEGSRREQSSDSSRRTYPYSGSGVHASLRSTANPNKSSWSNYAPSLDNSLMSNIQKLFSEKIEIFSRVEFSKVSVLTGIIKISLKTFLECVRLRTFSRHGLQQAQVDTHYLQIYLWRFVSDESLVHVLLDEIVGSSIHRCLDPVLMEPSVVEVICERG